MDNTEYDIVTDMEGIGVVAGVVVMDENREPIKSTFTPLALQRFEHMPCHKVVVQTFFMSPVERADVYESMADNLRDMADALEKHAQELS